MSRTNEELRAIEDMQADFDTAISEREWKDAQAIIDNLGDTGFENEALSLHHRLNRALAAEDEIPYDADNYRPEYPHE